MAKKIVRGISDIKEINKQDFDTNNVNDLLSDGEHNYIHRKKNDNSEEYHNLTNNLKTITSDNTDLLTVENNNNSNNSATLHPQHDSQKEQLIEAGDNTITIVSGKNSTTQKTKIKVSDELIETINTIITKYGENNTVRISGCVFTLNGSNLTVSTANNTEQNYVITFSDII
ncbi:hypothetical protein [Streptococcus phage vB_SbRt-pBovineS21]|nr:hypothetical protein [Streptococcus phage vB_SbRt-pBovineS21]